MKHVPMEELKGFVTTLLVTKNIPLDQAEEAADIIVDAEAFRQSTHGIVQLNAVMSAIGTTIDPTKQVTVVQDQGSVGLLNADGCLSISAMKKAREMAMVKAGQHGVGMVVVRNTGWIAALSTHLLKIVEQGFLARAWAQSNSCQDCAPFGGIDSCFSTNPIAIGFPTSQGPVVADFSTATMSMGAASNMIKNKEKTDLPRFIDKNGVPSHDPAVMDDSGTLMFAGGEAEGHKGYALSLFNEAMTVMAGGSANNPDIPGRQSFGLTVVDIEHFAGKGYYLKEMKRFTDRLKSSRCRPGVSEIRLPGERGLKALEVCREQGVPLDDGKCEMLRTLAEDVGIESVV